jgi:hypothetical protein
MKAKAEKTEPKVLIDDEFRTMYPNFCLNLLHTN